MPATINVSFLTIQNVSYCPEYISRILSTQWRSQDEQVTWAQHGHTQCVRINTHLLGDLGHTPAMKILHFEIASEAVVGHKYHSSDLPVCSLHVRMKLAITHAKLIFDRNFLHYFYPGTSEFNVGTGPGMPGCSYATVNSYVPIPPLPTNFRMTHLVVVLQTLEWDLPQ